MTRYEMWLGVLAFASLTQVSAAQSPERAILQSVQTAVQGDLTIVTIAADGPLPQPVSGAPDAPPRIFLDFIGVTPIKATGTTRMPGGGAVKQVRAALHSTAPNVTRVVLDLTRRETFRIDADARQSGRITIVVGSPSAMMPLAAASPGPTPPKPVGAPPAPSAPVAAASPSPLPAPAAPAAPAVSGLATAAGSGPALPPPTPKPVGAPPAPSAPASPSPLPAPAAPAAPAGSGVTTGAGPGPAIPSPTPTPPTPARRGPPGPEPIPSARLPLSEIENYRRQLAGALERLESRRAVVAAIDLDQSVAAEMLASTAADFRVLRRILEGTKPSESLRPAHNLLIAACELGAGAASLRSEADRNKDLQVRRNAASAAAGALMLLDRACAALGCMTIGR